jgi:hypothetical protein
MSAEELLTATTSPKNRRKPQTLKPQTANPQTANRKPQTANRKPQTANRKPQSQTPRNQDPDPHLAYSRAISMDAFCSDIWTLLRKVRKNGQFWYISWSSFSRSGSPFVYARIPLPTPYQAGSVCRDCAQPKTQGMARSEVLSRTATLRRAGRLPMFIIPISFTMVPSCGEGRGKSRENVARHCSTLFLIWSGFLHKQICSSSVHHSDLVHDGALLRGRSTKELLWICNVLVIILKCILVFLLSFFSLVLLVSCQTCRSRSLWRPPAGKVAERAVRPLLVIGRLCSLAEAASCTKGSERRATLLGSSRDVESFGESGVNVLVKMVYPSSSLESRFLRELGNFQQDLQIRIRVSVRLVPVRRGKKATRRC